MQIRPLSHEDERARCAAIMAASDPWLALGRTFDECLAALQQEARDIYVADQDGAIPGFIVIDMRGTFRGYIATVAVDEAARGKGVGSQLLDFAEEKILRESPNVFLFVTSFNTRARALYERRSYQHIGEVRDFIADGVSEHLMRMTSGPWKGFTPRP